MVFPQCWRRWDGAETRLQIFRTGDAGVPAFPGADAAGPGRRLSGANRRRRVQLHGVQQYRLEPLPVAPLPRRTTTSVERPRWPTYHQLNSQLPHNNTCPSTPPLTTKQSSKSINSIWSFSSLFFLLFSFFFLLLLLYYTMIFKRTAPVSWSHFLHYTINYHFIFLCNV